ncbi:MAG: hypothetical protein JXQ84_01895 [Rhodospirillaceae bacterium]|nr:hypothetical protein [Rhodospirillaceae bacterium]
MTVSDRLRQLRSDMKESQKGMAKRFALGENGWQRMELEGRAPKGNVLAQLVEMGFSADWLLTGDGHMRRGATLEAVDGTKLRTALEIIEDWLEEHDRKMSARKKAEVVAMAYEIITETEVSGQPELCRNNIVRLLRVAS